MKLRFRGELLQLLRSHSDGPNETDQFAARRDDNLVLVLTARSHGLVVFVQRSWASRRYPLPRR